MSKNPLEAGSQPLTSWERSKKKRPRVDVIVLLKILFFARVTDHLRQKRGRVYPNWI